MIETIIVSRSIPNNKLFNDFISTHFYRSLIVNTSLISLNCIDNVCHKIYKIFIMIYLHTIVKIFIQLNVCFLKITMCYGLSMYIILKPSI